MRIEADLHTHTIVSGHAYSTVGELAQAAHDKGLQVLGITDHGVNMPGGPHLYYFGNIHVIPSTIMGVQILKGVEANIIGTDGSLDMPDRILTKLDLVLAGLHSETGYSGVTVDDHTNAVINALYNPFVHIITHPGNPAYLLDMEAVVVAAKETNKALEINDSSFRNSRPGSLPRCQRLAQMAAQHDIWVSVNSDAHYHGNVAQCDIALRTALDAGIKPERILNLSAERVRWFLDTHRIQRQEKAV